MYMKSWTEIQDKWLKIPGFREACEQANKELAEEEQQYLARLERRRSKARSVRQTMIHPPSSRSSVA